MRKIGYDRLLPSELDKMKDAYKKIFENALADRKDNNGNDVEGLETKWLNWKNTNNAQAILKETVEDLLTADFDTLLDVYQRFLGLKIPESVTNPANGKPTRNPLLVELDKIFAHTGKYDSKIAQFFIDRASQLKISTCYYCDMAYVNTYTLSTVSNGFVEKRRQFDLDHYLPKGKCPCLGLSLFNFVPSCQVCNSRIKLEDLPHVKTNGDLKYLSPTSDDADFENHIKIRLRMRPSPKGIHANQYIYFKSDEPYREQVKFFHLEERYEFHKSEAINLKRLKDRYPDSKIEKIARLLHYRKSAVKEDIFRQKFVSENHRCFDKLTRDILGI